MQYKCQECNDTGSRDKLGTYLDCNACSTATIRRDLNDFVKSLGPTHPEDVALAIHQRALAMAPKQEAPSAVSEPANGVIICERKLFEKWAEENYCNQYAFPRGPGGESYENQIVQAYWKAWQARAALSGAKGN